MRLKRVNEQVIVITGGSSGIGLATARMAAHLGARVMLTSRDPVDLEQAVEAIRAEGGAATYLVADVADLDAIKRVAAAAVHEYGALDTWVNNAGVSVYGPIETVGLMDARRLFETNYWGVVNGTLAALPYLKANGGALINVGSALSEAGCALQGHFAASKHAVKAFTDSLRLELQEEGAPVAVTLIQPAAIDTPHVEHAKAYPGVETSYRSPVYAPEVVARAILRSAEHQERQVPVGSAGKLRDTMEWLVPTFARRGTVGGATPSPPPETSTAERDSLFGPRPGDARVRGSYPGHVRQSSLATRARQYRRQTLLGFAIAGAAVALLERAGVFGDGD